MLRNIIAIITFKAAPVFGLVFLNLFLAAQWKQESYGNYSLVVGALFFVGPLLGAGMPELVTRKASIYSYQNRVNAIAELHVKTITIIFSLVLLFYIALAFAEMVLHISFLSLLYTAPIVSLSLLSSAIRRAKGSVIVSQAIEAAFRLSIIAFSLLALRFFQLNEPEIKLIYIASSLLILVFIYMEATTERGIKKNHVKFYKKSVYRVLVNMGQPFLVISIMQGLKNFGDLFVVGYLLGPSSAAIYSIALQFVVILSFAQMVISVLMSRKISWALKTKQISTLNKWIENYKKYSLIIGLFVYFPIILIGHGLSNALLGENYQEALSIFAILGIGRLFHLHAGPVMQILALSNLQKAASNVTILVGIFNITISLILVSYFGLIGAAISGSLSIALWAYLLKKKVRLLIPELMSI